MSGQYASYWNAFLFHLHAVFGARILKPGWMLRCLDALIFVQGPLGRNLLGHKDC